MNYLLHSDEFQLMPFRGRLIKKQIEKRAMVVAEATKTKTDPSISTVIRSKNDGEAFKTLLADIAAQEYNGKIEIIVVDTESSDGTPEYAVSKGAKVISISQAEFTYPKALNIGFKAAKYPYVAVLVGHSSLSSRYFLKSISYWQDTENLGGIYNLPLSGLTASWIEKCSYLFGQYDAWKHPKVIRHAKWGGILGANCSIISKKAWQEMKGFDERFAGGGEDLDMARRMLKANMRIIREPLCSPFHAHGLGLINSAKQMLHWMEVAKDKPQPFNQDKIYSRRPDLRQKQ